MTGCPLTPRVARQAGIAGLHIRTTRTQLASLCLKEIDAHVPEGLEVYIVMDNYAYHKTPKIKAWLTRRPHFHVPLHANFGVMDQSGRALAANLLLLSRHGYHAGDGHAA